MPRKGHKSQAGIGDLYESPKVKLNITVTEDAKTALDERAKQLGISKSELIERFARGIVGLPQQEAAVKKRKRSPKLSSAG
jgi:hypothetical protein